MQPGYRYALSYSPGKGTTLALNGIDLGTIEREDLAAASFSMWLGRRPLSDSLKKDLSGQAQIEKSPGTRYVKLLMA